MAGLAGAASYAYIIMPGLFIHMYLPWLGVARRQSMFYERASRHYRRLRENWKLRWSDARSRSLCQFSEDFLGGGSIRKYPKGREALVSRQAYSVVLPEGVKGCLPFLTWYLPTRFPRSGDAFLLSARNDMLQSLFLPHCYSILLTSLLFKQQGATLLKKVHYREVKNGWYVVG